MQRSSAEHIASVLCLRENDAHTVHLGHVASPVKLKYLQASRILTALKARSRFLARLAYENRGSTPWVWIPGTYQVHSASEEASLSTGRAD